MERRVRTRFAQSARGIRVKVTLRNGAPHAPIQRTHGVPETYKNVDVFYNLRIKSFFEHN